MRAILSLVFAAALALAGAAPVTVHDIDGRAWTLFTPAAGHVDLVLFIDTDCPISNRYAPEISRIAREYAPRGVRTFLVYPDVDTTNAAVKTHRQDFSLTSLPAIIDKTHTLVKAVNASVTPEAAVYSAKGLVYRGRIDDWYVDASHMRQQPTRHDVRLALDAALAGTPISPSMTEAVGCVIVKRP